MTNVGTPMTKILKLGCGNEVKGEGYILNLILYSFLGFFRFLTLGYPFNFPLPRIYIKKSFQTFTLHLFGDSFDDQRVTGEGW